MLKIHLTVLVSPSASVTSTNTQTLYGNDPVHFCETRGDKLISTDFTIYLF